MTVTTVATNLISNGSFEDTSLTGWAYPTADHTVSSSTTYHPFGSYGVDIGASSTLNNEYIVQEGLPLINTHYYYATIMGYSDSGGLMNIQGGSTDSGGIIYASKNVTSTSPTRLSIVFTADRTNSSGYIEINGEYVSGAGFVYTHIDGVVLIDLSAFLGVNNPLFLQPTDTITLVMDQMMATNMMGRGFFNGNSLTFSTDNAINFIVDGSFESGDFANYWNRSLGNGLATLSTNEPYPFDINGYSVTGTKMFGSYGCRIYSGNDTNPTTIRRTSLTLSQSHSYYATARGASRGSSGTGNAYLKLHNNYDPEEAVSSSFLHTDSISRISVNMPSYNVDGDNSITADVSVIVGDINTGEYCAIDGIMILDLNALWNLAPSDSVPIPEAPATDAIVDALGGYWDTYQLPNAPTFTLEQVSNQGGGGAVSITYSGVTQPPGITVDEYFLYYLDITVGGTATRVRMDITGNPFILYPLTGGHNYTFWVSCADSQLGLESNLSSPQTMLVKAIPSIPGNLHITSYTAHTNGDNLGDMSFAWDAQTGTDYYSVQFQQVGGSGTWTALYPNPTTNSFTIYSVPTNSKFSFRLQATNVAGSSGYTTSFTTDNSAGNGGIPGTPLFGSPDTNDPVAVFNTGANHASVVLQWKQQAIVNLIEVDPDHYNIYRDSGSGYTLLTTTIAVDDKTNTYTDLTVSPGVNSYKITAVITDIQGQDSYSSHTITLESAYSVIKTVTVPEPPGAPILHQAGRISYIPTTISVEWALGTGSNPDGFNVYLYRQSDSHTPIASQTGLTAYAAVFTNISVNPADRVVLNVDAYNSGGVGVTSITIVDPPTAPSGTQSFSTTRTPYGLITLHWTASTDNGGVDSNHFSYVVVRTPPGGTEGPSPTLSMTGATSASDTGTQAEPLIDGIYNYRVYAQNTDSYGSVLTSAYVAFPTISALFDASPISIINSDIQYYNGKPFVRVEWEKADHADTYSIERSPIGNWPIANPGTDWIAGNPSWNLSFFDANIESNTTYTYTVNTFVSGDNTPGGAATTTITTPVFTTPAIQSGPTEWTAFAQLSVSVVYPGYPAIILTYSNPNQNVLGVQIAADGTNFEKQAPDSTTSKLFNTFGGKPLQPGTVYNVKAVIYDINSNIIKQTNTVAVKTYTVDSSAFPNLMPNAGLQYQYYIDPSLATNSNGTWLNENSTNCSVINMTSTTSQGATIHFKSPGFFELTGVTSGAFVTNKSAYKIPVKVNIENNNPIVKRTYALCANYAVDYNLGVPGDEHYGVFVASLASTLGSTTQGAQLRSYHDYHFTSAEPALIVTTFTLFDTNQQPQIQFYNADTSGQLAFAGNFMLFDLNAVFDGDGANILDNTNNITPTMIQDIINLSLAQWWDFDYQSNAYKPISPPVVPQDLLAEHNFQVDIDNCSDDDGGMDSSGYMPIMQYTIAYKQWKDRNYTLQTVEPFYTATTAVNFSVSLAPSSKYQLKYDYFNFAGIASDFTDSLYIDTPPLASKISGVILTDLYKPYYDSNTIYTGPALQIQWTPDPNVDLSKNLPAPALATNYYNIYIGTDPKSLQEISVPYLQDTFGQKQHSVEGIVINPNTVYYVRISGVNAWGEGPLSNLYAITSITAASAPLNPTISFASNGQVTFNWDAPNSNGGIPIIKYNVTWWINDGIPVTLSAGNNLSLTNNAIIASKGDNVYFKVSAINQYTEDLSEANQVFSITATSKFITTIEYIKIRGYADSEGYFNFYFTARETYTQASNTYWVFCAGIEDISLAGGYQPLPFPQATDLNGLKLALASPNLYVFEVPQQPSTTSGWTPGWPTFVNNRTVNVTTGTDILGGYILLEFEMYPENSQNYDVHTELVGFDGFNSVMIVTDYTSDIQFEVDNHEVITLEDINSTGTGSIALIWTINAALENDASTIPGEEIPRTVNYFFIPIEVGDTLDTISDKITNPSGIDYFDVNSGTTKHVDYLEKQINDYYTLISPLRSLYINNSVSQAYSDTGPFEVIVTGTTVDGKNHIQVNIKAYLESIENQISMQAQNLYAFYTSTKPNTYYINESMYELRSFEDMYGRNKPGSSTISGYTKRSYGFKFALDVVTSYTDTEASPIDMTAIPGLSTAYNIGLDTTGPGREIYIEGVRVDNMNQWMFNAPFEYMLNRFQGDTATGTGGVMYVGTSNWGWIKFLKATLGTFQFIDGPYRLIVMTIPSSAMQQYVLNRNCKYQYSDGTLIIQAGFEDMCYVILSNFQVIKTADMTNAITYQLRMNRVIPLGSSP